MEPRRLSLALTQTPSLNILESAKPAVNVEDVRIEDLMRQIVDLQQTLKLSEERFQSCETRIHYLEGQVSFLSTSIFESLSKQAQDACVLKRRIESLESFQAEDELVGEFGMVNLLDSRQCHPSTKPSLSKTPLQSTDEGKRSVIKSRNSAECPKPKKMSRRKKNRRFEPSASPQSAPSLAASSSFKSTLCSSSLSSFVFSQNSAESLHFGHFSVGSTSNKLRLRLPMDSARPLEESSVTSPLNSRRETASSPFREGVRSSLGSSDTDGLERRKIDFSGVDEHERYST